MEQLVIYEYCGIEDDPLFQKISSMKPGEEIYLEKIKVRKNAYSIYEIETEDLHVPYSDKEVCYKKIMSILNRICEK